MLSKERKHGMRDVMVFVGCIVACLLWYRARSRRPLATDVRTGDLVLFERRGVDLNTVVTHFAHVGIALVIDGVPYVVESHAEGPRPGVHMYLLDDRARTYDGDLWIASSTIPLDIDPTPYLDCGYDTTYRQHFIRSCIVGVRETSRRGVFCSELVALLLRDAGVVIDNPSCATPDSLAALPIYREPRRWRC